MSRPVVLVTGAAHGIGRATAERFAAEGWLVGVYDVDLPAVGALVEELTERFGEGSAVGGRLDVTVPEQWTTALEQLTSVTSGRLDLLINNAGILRGGRLHDVDLAEHRRTIEVNVLGVINGAHAAYPFLRETPRSGMINLCSASAIYGQPELAAYSASKFAVRGLTEALELEWRRDDIRVQAVWPLFVDTEMVAGIQHVGSVESLGVHLTATEVAESIWRTARRSRHRSRLRARMPKVHTAVGWPAKLLAASADLSPAPIAREVNRRISRS